VIQEGLTVCIDTRERLCWKFDKSQRQTLRTGDYCLQVAPTLAVVERKSLPDIFGTVGRGRKRFERELVRMQDYRWRTIVIEGTLPELVTWRSPRAGKVQASHVLGSLLAWEIRYGVTHCFAGPREYAARYAYRWLEMRYRVWQKELAQLG